MNGHYTIGETVLGNWTLTRLIGQGSYGKVYEAERLDFGVTYKAAIKIITIPQSRSEIISAQSEGMSDADVTAYFRNVVEQFVQEFALMAKLKGTANIVSYEDHAVLPHEDEIGWDVIIRMELLTPLLEYVMHHSFQTGDVIKLGTDICKALELCKLNSIVHRDIKPENIFISELGDFKLGDFGIARTVEKTSGGLSKKGTYTYMAPEVYKEEPYNTSVDIYSLGIVLYRFLNDNRTPFLPPAPKPITYKERENAQFLRMSGVEIPPPKQASKELSRIVLKACAFSQKNRYSDPAEMRYDLEHCGESYEVSPASSAFISATQSEESTVKQLTIETPPETKDESSSSHCSAQENQRFQECTAVDRGTSEEKSVSVKKDTPSVSNMPRGMMGALLGSLLSVVVWITMAQIGIGPFSGIAGIATVFLAIRGYEWKGKALDKKGAIACSAVIVFSVFLLFKLSYSYAMAAAWQNVPWVWQDFLWYFGNYFGDGRLPLYIVSSYLFTGLGGFLYYIRFRKKKTQSPNITGG